MSFGLFAGNVAAGFGSAIKTAERMADRRYEQEGRDEVRAERGRAKSQRERDEAYQVGLEKVFGGEQQDVAPAQPSDSTAAPAPSPAPAPASGDPAAAPTALTTPPVADSGVGSSAAADAAPKPAPLFSRPSGLNNPATLRAAASMALKARRFDDFAKFAEQSDKLSWKQSAETAAQLRAASSGMSTLDVVKKAGEIFNDDIGAGRIENIAENKDGTVSFDSYNTSNGQRFRRTVKSASEALEQLDSFYSPENFRAIQKARTEAEIERRKPRTLKPGDQEFVDGKLVNENTNETNASVADRRLAMGLTGAGGSGGTGTGSRSKSGDAKTPEDLASSAVFDASEKADGAMKLSPEMMTTAQSGARNVARLNPGLDPFDAAQVGIAMARDPAAAKPTLDVKTGRVMATVDTANGKRIAVREVDPNKLDPEVRKGFADQAKAMVAQLEKDDPVVGPLIKRAAFGGEAEKNQLKDVLIKLQTERLAATPAARGKSGLEINAAATRLVDGQLQQLSGRMTAIRTFGTPPPPVKQGGQPGPAQDSGPTAEQRPGYTPPADSPAGRARARREEIAAQTRVREEARRTQLTQEASAAAQQALASRDLADAAAAQDMPGFKLLPAEQQRAISSIVIGR